MVLIMPQTPETHVLRALAGGHEGTRNEAASSSHGPKLMDRLHQALRSRHYSRRTEQTYCHWVRRYIFFHKVRHPAEMAEPEINAFLTHLAVKEKVSASTQNQALSALLFLYRHVLNYEVGNLGEVVRARKSTRLPVVMTRDEVKAMLVNLSGDKWLMASLMYGAGLRLMECLRLRVRDLESSFISSVRYLTHLFTCPFRPFSSLTNQLPGYTITLKIRFVKQKFQGGQWRSLSVRGTLIFFRDY